jgi:hypothetical protein
LNDFLKGQINCYCEAVKRDMKPMALLPVQDRYLEEIENFVRDEEKLNLCSKKLCDGWVSVFIYKYEYLKDVIEELPEHPKTVYEHWILGKAFGYSDNSIEDFVNSKLL